MTVQSETDFMTVQTETHGCSETDCVTVQSETDVVTVQRQMV